MNLKIMISMGKIVFIVLILILTQCKKKTERTHYTIDDSLKSYCVFPPGSYWKFILEGPNLADSIFIYNLSSYTESSNSEDEGPLNDIITTTFISKFLSEFYVDHQGLLIFDKTGGMGISLLSGIQPGKKFVDSSNGIYEYIEFLDSISHNGIIFHNVIHSKYTGHTISSDTNKFEYYLSKKVGLIKFKKTMNGIDSVWNLTKYYIKE